MSSNDANDYALRLYNRIPAQYRVYDAEQGRPLLALMTVVGKQVAGIRQDLDALWDNFFIETSDDWVVPYLAALVGTNLLAHPVGQSNRLDVWNTVRWRRSKGTPAMLRAMTQEISGWPVDRAEFFQALGWSQNLNHVRPDRTLTPDLHDIYRLSLLGRAADPFAHAADFKPAHALDQPRVATGSVGLGQLGWGTPGRYRIKNLGVFVRRLQTFPLRGVTPAAVAPGLATPANASCFTFDPLFREMPLFVEATAEPITRVALDVAPWRSFGTDVCVRQYGVPLAGDSMPQPAPSSGHTPFTFGGAGQPLDATNGIRLMDPRSFAMGGAHFVITAGWFNAGGSTPLGSLSTLHAALSMGDAFKTTGAAATGAGQLAITVQTDRDGLGWAGMPASPAARFPGAVLALRGVSVGAARVADAVYVYLPAAYVTPSAPRTYYVATDGSTYTSADLGVGALARESEGSVYPPRPLTSSAAPANDFIVLNRKEGALRIADPGRIGGVAVLFEVGLFTGVFQSLGAIATTDQAQGQPRFAELDFAALGTADPWPAFSFVPSVIAVSGALDDTKPDKALLTVRVTPLAAAGTFVPATELVVVNRFGQSLLVYLPEMTNVGNDGALLAVADDGTTYQVATNDINNPMQAALDQRSYSGLQVGRESAEQVLPIAGIWPLQQRKPVGLNLCRCERSSLLRQGEIGIDPELGRFAFESHDPVIGLGGLSVDYVEAFSDRVGARTFVDRLDPAIPPTRLISRSGDAASALNPKIASDHIHTSVDAALSAAQDGDIIEIVDSATYAANAAIIFARPSIRSLTLRAADRQRPCLAFYHADGTSTSAGLHITSSMDRLELNGLLISGGPLLIEGEIQQLQLIASTLDPRTAAATGSLVATDPTLQHHANYLLCRCISGAVLTAAGIEQVTIADSIVDQYGGLAIGCPPVPGTGVPDAPAQRVQLERVTVLGRIHCDTLSASACLLDAPAIVDDRQAGCVRFSRYEVGSVLPRRYQCVPSDQQAAACRPPGRCVAPLFNSRQFGRPTYGQLASACPEAILTASDAGAEVGAFAGTLTTIRLGNVQTKLREFVPVGLEATVIAET